MSRICENCGKTKLVANVVQRDNQGVHSRTSTPKKVNFHYRNQLCPKNYQLERSKISLPPINNRQYMNQPINSPIKKGIFISNISSNINSINNPQIKFINSFSDARLPNEFCDLSYDNPKNK